MKILKLLLFISVVVGCTSYPPFVESPPPYYHEDGSVLIVGCVIFEQIWLEHTYTINHYHSEHPYFVILGYRAAGSTSERLKQIWVRTDSEGYFILPNAPAGEYYLAGSGTQSESGGLALRCWYATRRNESYWRKDSFGSEDEVDPQLRAPVVWPEPLPGNVYNLKYWVFTEALWNKKQSSREFNAEQYESLNGEEFICGIEYLRPPVPEYLIEKYPGSDWSDVLRKIKP